MRHLILGTALCFMATTASAGGNHDTPQPAPKPAASKPAAPSRTSTTNNVALAGAAAAAAANSRGGAGGLGGAGGVGGNANNGGQTMNYSGGGYSARGNNVDAFAPNVSTANECGLPKSAGVSFLGIGISGGFANESDDCKQRQMMMFLASTGDKAMAREMACQSNDLARRAAYSSGRPCARDARGWDRR